MKKLFTLALALMGLTTVANAATVDDIAVLKHSYVLVCDNYTGNGTVARVKGNLFGANQFLDVTGGSIETKKGSATLGDASTLTPFNCTADEVTALAAKYAKYTTSQYNSLRLKNNQDVIAAKLTAGSVVWFIGQGNNKSGKDARIPKIAKDAKLETEALNAAPTADDGSTPAGYVYKWTVPDDGLYYFGSYNGDMFLSYIVVEANEAPGTPMVDLTDQAYADGLWSRTITVTPQNADGEETVVLYTTDGTNPTESSSAKVYTEPIVCYKDQTVKLQSYFKALYDIIGVGLDSECPGADYDVEVDFSFKAPTITAEGGNVTISTDYENATNVYSYGDVEGEGNTITLTQSATVKAYTKIKNGSHTTFESLPTTQDVYVLNPITEAKTIKVTGGTVEEDAEATASATDGKTVYKVTDGTISADPADFFVKNLSFGVVNGADAKYQVPEGEERYIKMSDTNISFMVKDPVKVKVVCSKNSCKTLNPTNDENVTSARQCYVNVSGTTYGTEDITGGDVANLDGYKNVIEFNLPALNDKKNEDAEVIGKEFENVGDGKVYTFQKYSGTGNILISSIEITPLTDEEIVALGIDNITTVAPKANGAIFNLAGQKVNADYKGIVIKNGKKVLVK